MANNNGHTHPGAVYVETYGCQMNKLDSELVLGRLFQNGHRWVDDPEQADTILFNTCSVREHAEERVYSRVGAMKFLKKRRPGTIIGIIGCMAQNHRDQIFRRLPHVDLIVGPHKLGAIPRLIDEVRQSGQRRIAVEDFDDEYVGTDHAAQGREVSFQAYIKIMEGCDLNCTFCIVPTVRGRERSRPVDDIVAEARALAAQGCVEIMLLGQTVNSYGKQLKPRSSLAELLGKVSEVEGIRRLRFITSHPAFVTPELIEAMRDLPKVCKYLHIPVQSGSNGILKAMKRLYTRERYLEIVADLRREVPGIQIATDFIVGFPGETEDDFRQTADLLREVRFQNAFVFKYSSRPGTVADGMNDDVPEEVKKERNQILLDAQKEISLELNRGLIGTVQEVLVEGPSKNNPQRYTGRTDGYSIVVFDPAPYGAGQGVERHLTGQFVRVKIVDATPLTLMGRLE